MPDPPIRFSPWTPWPTRQSIPNAHLPGVYLLARFDQPPLRRVDPLDAALVYIGEVSDSSLLGRWQQFQRAAFAGTPGHSAGLIYRDLFGDAGESLCVSAFVPEGLTRELR